MHTKIKNKNGLKKWNRYKDDLKVKTGRLYKKQKNTDDNQKTIGIKNNNL